jgi:dimethylargininase
MPDAVFVEDTAIVLDEVAVITRPGATSRQPETASIAMALEPYRELRFIEAPATIDGGDVLRVGKSLFVGMTSRSSAEGIAQLRELVAPFGYTVTGVPVTGCLHLKTAVTQIAPDMLLINPAYVDPLVFDMHSIEVDPSEPFGGNAVLISDTVIYPSAFPRTRRRMEQAGIRVQTVDASELAKAEGGVTCCSLLFTVADDNRVSSMRS